VARALGFEACLVTPAMSSRAAASLWPFLARAPATSVVFGASFVCACDESRSEQQAVSSGQQRPVDGRCAVSAPSPDLLFASIKAMISGFNAPPQCMRESC
jgi:hypothetical protein